MSNLGSIVNSYPITETEFIELDSKFGRLCCYAGWQLKKKNSKNAMINDPEDDIQELKIALLRAGSYYKRQTFIEDCFVTLERHVKDKFTKAIVKELQCLWKDRRKHGAGRQKFGHFQEAILEKLVNRHVPEAVRPLKTKELQIDSKFSTYCKQIVWNAQKSLGKQITREKEIRTGMVSLSEFDYLGSEK